MKNYAVYKKINNVCNSKNDYDNPNYIFLSNEHRIITKTFLDEEELCCHEWIFKHDEFDCECEFFKKDIPEYIYVSNIKHIIKEKSYNNTICNFQTIIEINNKYVLLKEECFIKNKIYFYLPENEDIKGKIREFKIECLLEKNLLLFRTTFG